MPIRNADKHKDVLKELEKTISPILVVNNSSLKPYVELFEYLPENIYQQPLGNLVGFFEIKDYSDDSAYVVNFLTSVLKKEYYINPRRSVTESFDAALHKVNLALSELAKHGNVEWLGKLNAAICVFEKNSVHFSVSGNAMIFIHRNQNLSNISDGLACDSIEPHPLKTFVNVSSGRLEKKDRILITQEDIFHVLTLAELKKNYERMDKDKFVQFLKTALSNQLEMVAAICVDAAESKPAKSVKKISPQEETLAPINAFAATTFAKKEAASQEQEASIPDEQSSSDYTDKKTGHIYVQGETHEARENSQAHIYWEVAKEKMASGWLHTKNAARLRFVILKKQIAKSIEQRKAANEQKKIEREQQAELQRQYEMEQQAEQERLLAEQQLLEQQQAELGLQRQKEAEELALAQEKIEAKKQAKKQRASVINLKEQQLPKEEILEIPELEKELPIEIHHPAEFGDESGIQTGRLQEAMLILKDYSVLLLQKSSSLWERLQEKIIQAKKEKTESLPQSTNKEKSELIPHPSKLLKLFSKFTSKQKAYVAAALVLIFIVPLFIAHWLNRPKAPTINSLAVAQPSATDVLAMDKNIKLDTQKQVLLSRSNLLATLITNNGPIAISPNGVTMISNGQQKDYNLPSGNGNIVRATYMSDLELVLLLTDQNKVVSFSPISFQFVSNNIKLDDVSASSFAGTYMTYLYVLDPKANQIYRYPRATGGFADRTNWYKDNLSLAQVTDLAMDENIYTLESNQVLKFFKGQKQDFKLETSNTPVQLSKIFTTTDDQFFYVLDTKNSRIVKYGKDGQISAQFYNEALSGGTSLSVDEKNNTAYVTTSSNLISISLQ
ncbi:MAG TPA: hypothetical protein VF817_00320 [Patescibacteria group bacterium]